MVKCLVRTVPIVVRAPRAAVLAAPVLAVGENAPIVPAGVPVVTMIDAPVATLIPIAPALLVTTMTADLDVVSEIHRAPVLVVPMNPGIVDPPVTPTVTTTDHVGPFPTETVAPRVTMTVAHLALTAAMTVDHPVMVGPVRPDHLLVVTGEGHVMAAPVHLVVSSTTAVEPRVAMTTVAHHVRTAVTIAVLPVTEGLVRHVANSMIAVVALAAPARRAPARPVATTTVRHATVGARIAPRRLGHHATSLARGFSEMMLDPVSTEMIHDPVSTEMTAPAVVALRTAIVGSVRLRPKSKNELMPSALLSLVGGVA